MPGDAKQAGPGDRRPPSRDPDVHPIRVLEDAPDTLHRSRLQQKRDACEDRGRANDDDAASTTARASDGNLPCALESRRYIFYYVLFVEV